MQPVATVGDVGGPGVLAGRQQVPDTNRDQGAERNLERPAAHIHVVASCGAGMQVYAVGADAHAVVEVLRSPRPASRLDAHVLLQHRELGPDAATLAHVNAPGEAVRGTDDVGTKTQAPVPYATVEPVRLGLHPVQHREAELPRTPQMFVSLRFFDAYERAEPVVYLRPVDQGDVAIEQAIGDVLAGEYAPVVPEVGAVTPGEEGFFVEDRAVAGPQGVGVDVGPGELLAGPETRLVAAPEVVILGLVYRVVLSGHVVERKAPAHRLLI